MKSPRAPAGAGIAGAFGISLGSDHSKAPVASAGSRFNYDVRTRNAADIDRQADLLLSIGRHSAAERLSHRAAELREVAA